MTANDYITANNLDNAPAEPSVVDSFIQDAARVGGFDPDEPDARLLAACMAIYGHRTGTDHAAAVAAFDRDFADWSEVYAMAGVEFVA